MYDKQLEQRAVDTATLALTATKAGAIAHKDGKALVVALIKAAEAGALTYAHLDQADAMLKEAIDAERRRGNNFYGLLAICTSIILIVLLVF